MTIVPPYPYLPNEPMPISSMFAEPTMIAPASLSFLTAAASIGEMKPFKIVEPPLDYMPFIRMLSFIAIGIPSSFDFASSKRD